MKLTLGPSVVRVTLVSSLANLVGFSAATLTQTQPSNFSQGNVKAKAAPARAYRRLNPEKDGLAFEVSDISFWAQNGGTSMKMVIGGITFTNPRGQEMQIELASQTVIGGLIRTVNFGTMQHRSARCQQPECDSAAHERPNP